MIVNLNKKLKILLIPRWYPHRYDPMPGIFIKRQAEVISSFSEVAVIYVHEDTECPNKYEIDTIDENGVQVIRVYYQIPKNGLPLLNNLIRLCRFFKANLLGFKMIHSFQPDMVHVHALTRQGLIAYIYKIINRKPYVITEHWSRYFIENGTYKGWIRKWITNLVVKQASSVIAVSEKLKNAMIHSGLQNSSFYVIGNQVDMDHFKSIEKEGITKKLKKRIIHISCFEDKSKNISGFLRIISRLARNRMDFECRLIGYGPEWLELKNYAIELGISSELVSFTGLKEEDELVKEINNADFLVLSSQYETFGTVIIETLACGIPVVSCDVGIASEVINYTNGMIVPTDNEKDLEEAIHAMLDRCNEYDRLKIRQSVFEKYNNQVIGDQLHQIYNSVVNKSLEKK